MNILSSIRPKNIKSHRFNSKISLITNNKIQKKGKTDSENIIKCLR